MQVACSVLDCLEIGEPGQVNRKPHFLALHQRRIFHEKLAAAGPYRRTERLDCFRLRSWRWRFRTLRTRSQESNSHNDVDLLHGRPPALVSSAPTTRSSSMNASRTPCCKSNSRRLAKR